jgi:uncharacterized repeat protein (TIGR04138 family)
VCGYCGWALKIAGLIGRLIQLEREKAPFTPPEADMPIDVFQIAAETKYPAEAFTFVQRGLDFTVQRTHGELDETDPEQSRHVTGADLCIGLRDFALREYGLLARSVLRRWNIRTCEDFGHIVFAMVEAGVLQKTDDDDLTDFANVFNFDEAFAAELSI